ncbi:HEPN domain-containing protein [Runella slithyformis]|uniref:HEPN domain protein n=1 Tax=Runella slithyformis (strain ATCC 29530 / DSM 19594 / LMG 11500 / NCIMB 11436 / LSU 4) TaxID=761193 RepID=A0A7U3ZHI1_RUNSL|nr:HEPN domain-containing protein [Runella slithyformis]AEI47337.1 HEPN domain protein [Runella slithyformis DSM 19594]
MATAAELKVMADNRLNEAELLYENRFYAGAYYLSGYAVEFGLKAVICKRLNIEMFEKNPSTKNIAKAFQIHDLSDLIILSGLHEELEGLKSTDAGFAKLWSIVSGWTEQRRYEFGCKQQTSRRFLTSVKTFMSWIQLHW